MVLGVVGLFFLIYVFFILVYLGLRFKLCDVRGSVVVCYSLEKFRVDFDFFFGRRNFLSIRRRNIGRSRRSGL